ncbi:MAG: sulfite oxidase [Pseudomonadota bacterium]|jgi:sulfoxide reductase heme-binding subunit YedZ
MAATLPRGAIWWLHPAAKPVCWLLCLLPALWLVYGAATNQLGANPAEALIRATGLWTLRMLCVVLAVTPLRKAAGWHGLARLRRMFGLYVFFYAVLHLLSYAWLDMGFVWDDIVRDIPKRPFVLVGVTAFVGLLLLAATSFNRAIRALGAARWQRLHRLVYAIAGLGLLHFLWVRSSKHREIEVLVYAVVIALLLLARLWQRRRRPGAPT